MYLTLEKKETFLVNLISDFVLALLITFNTCDDLFALFHIVSVHKTDILSFCNSLFAAFSLDYHHLIFLTNWMVIVYCQMNTSVRILFHLLCFRAIVNWTIYRISMRFRFGSRKKASHVKLVDCYPECRTFTEFYLLACCWGPVNMGTNSKGLLK